MLIALYPGIWKFMTGYSPLGEMLQVGKGDVAKIYRLDYALDHIQSEWSQKGVKHGKRWRMRKVGARASAKICQTVQDLHEKLAKFFCTRFSVILLSKFQPSAMVCGDHKKFEAKAARALAT
ncbi:hypothetical protein GAYE_SCF06G2739 [Galdieria yellowstonensis]|uniref:Uncharacterized protein n=1 Tax=Galdieria yellowstonensis TaxID=3028027 RepID=A0AAV9IBY4_9RHOD|nr:hypothetical protein GAYE_SCF06G2739 [Galdieria yellowstonensis]